MNANMPEVDRAAAARAAVAARAGRAEVKRKVAEGTWSGERVLDEAAAGNPHASSLRVTEFLTAFPTIGATKTRQILERLEISERKRLGGLGKLQRDRLRTFIRSRFGSASATGAPRLTVLAGPTAVGKGTVANYVREHHPEVQLSISATTRSPRPGEIDGVHYYFVSDEEFDRMLAHDELLEWATVHNSYRYGTPKGPVEAAANDGKHVLLEIDLQGARQVRAHLPSARLVFLQPPSWEELVRRLVGRGTEDSEERERRLATARVELAAVDEFDEVIVNDEVARAASQLVQIMTESSA